MKTPWPPPSGSAPAMHGAGRPYSRGRATPKGRGLLYSFYQGESTLFNVAVISTPRSGKYPELFNPLTAKLFRFDKMEVNSFQILLVNVTFYL